MFASIDLVSQKQKLTSLLRHPADIALVRERSVKPLDGKRYKIIYNERFCRLGSIFIMFRITIPLDYEWYFYVEEAVENGVNALCHQGKWFFHHLPAVYDDDKPRKDITGGAPDSICVVWARDIHVYFCHSACPLQVRR